MIGPRQRLPYCLGAWFNVRIEIWGGRLVIEHRWMGIWIVVLVLGERFWLMSIYSSQDGFKCTLLNTASKTGLLHLSSYSNSGTS